MDVDASRIGPTRRRITLAKAALGIGAALAFGGALALSRLSNAGHSKEPVRPLSPTRNYVAAVRKNVGSTGIIDGPISSPSTSTGVS